MSTSKPSVDTLGDARIYLTSCGYAIMAIDKPPLSYYAVDESVGRLPDGDLTVENRLTPRLEYLVLQKIDGISPVSVFSGDEKALINYANALSGGKPKESW